MLQQYYYYHFFTYYKKRSCANVPFLFQWLIYKMSWSDHSGFEMFIQGKPNCCLSVVVFKEKQSDNNSQTHENIQAENVMLNCSTCTISPTWTLTQPLMKQLVFIRGVPSGADISSSTVPALWSTTEPLPAHWVDSVSGVRCPFCLTSCDHSVSCHCGFLCVPLQARLQDDQDHEQAAHLLEVQ